MKEAQCDSTTPSGPPFLFEWRGMTVQLFPASYSHVYLIHFERPFKHARHYLGFVGSGGLNAWLARHGAGQGARLLQVVRAAGIEWQLSRLWRFTDEQEVRDTERRLKSWRGSVQLCPVRLMRVTLGEGKREK